MECFMLYYTGEKCSGAERIRGRLLHESDICGVSVIISIHFSAQFLFMLDHGQEIFR